VAGQFAERGVGVRVSQVLTHVHQDVGLRRVTMEVAEGGDQYLDAGGVGDVGRVVAVWVLIVDVAHA